MRKRITLLIAALMLALTMSFGAAGAAFAGHTGSHKNPQSPACVKDRGGDNPTCPGPRR
jgi:hypothetical protein